MNWGKNMELTSTLVIFEFNFVPTLVGHKELVTELKVIDKEKKMFISGSSKEKVCKLLDVSSGVCVRTLKGHESDLSSIMVLSNKIFASGSNEILFWHIDEHKFIKKIEMKKKGGKVILMSQVSEASLAACEAVGF